MTEASLTAPAEKKPGLLRKIFNANTIGSAAVGFVAGFGTRTTIALLVASTAPGLAVGAVAALTIASGAFATGISVTVFQRAMDIRAHNSKNPENKIDWRTDFFSFDKTGHSQSHYMKRAGLSILFAIAGGAIGYGVASYFNVPHGASLPAGPETGTPSVPPVLVDPPVAPPVEVVPPVDVPAVDVPPVEAPHVDTPPVDTAPTVDPAPTPDPAPVDPAPVDPLPPAPPVVPSLDARIDDVLNEAHRQMPEKLSKKLSGVLSRIDSSNLKVRAQALKDLGYYFSNGFGGVHENDALANKLYELSLEVSGGKNIQAAHDLGYHMLHGKGAAVDHERAIKLLVQAKKGGHPLSGDMLKYIKLHRLYPQVSI